MFWTAAQKIYVDCKRLGLCRSQRDFSRRWLGRGPHYMRLVKNRSGFTSRRTDRTLRHRLEQERSRRPDLSSSITALLDRITQAEAMGNWLRRQ